MIATGVPLGGIATRARDRRLAGRAPARRVDRSYLTAEAGVLAGGVVVVGASAGVVVDGVSAGEAGGVAAGSELQPTDVRNPHTMNRPKRTRSQDWFID